MNQVKTEKEKFEEEYYGSLKEVVVDGQAAYVDKRCVNVEKLIIGDEIYFLDGYRLYSGSTKVREIVIGEGNKYFKTVGKNCIYDKRYKEIVVYYGDFEVPEGTKKLSLGYILPRAESQPLYIGKDIEEITLYREFSISEIILEEGNKTFELEGGCLFRKGSNEVFLGAENSVIPERATSIGGNAFYKVNIDRIEIPSTVTKICCSAFANTKIKTFDFKNVTEIEKNAFGNCENLEEITLPNAVTEINEYTFQHCSNLKKVDFGGAASIGEYAFSKCAFESLDLPRSIKNIEKDAFYGCENLTEVTIPESVTSVCGFRACTNLEKVNLPDNAAEIANEAFGFCNKLKSIKIPNSVTKIGEEAFITSGLETIEIPESVKDIGKEAFAFNRSLASVKLPEGLKVIPEEAFRECLALTEIRLPKSIETIEDLAFFECKNLQSVNFDELINLKKISRDAFTSCRKLKKPEEPKKPLKLKKEYYCSFPFEEVAEQCGKMKKLELWKEIGSTASFEYKAAFTYKEKNYLMFEKKKEKFFVSFGDEAAPFPGLDEEATKYCGLVHTCIPITEGKPLYDELIKFIEEK